jgi:serine/threonine protein phosphatase PrpC
LDDAVTQAVRAKNSFGNFLTQVRDLRLSSNSVSGTALVDDYFFAKLTELIRSRVPSRSGAKGNGRFAVGTSIGLVRTANEDRCAVLKARFGGAPNKDFNVGIVCDGLGGMDAGQDAAVTAVAAFLATLLSSSTISPLARLQEAISEANLEVHGHLRGRGGTTLSAVLITRHQGSYLCHAGDSRIFAIGTQRSLHQLTRDDTLGSLLGRDSDDGNRDNRLVQFVGVGEDLEPQLRSVPDGATSFLLTTDGAHDLPASVITRLVANAGSPLELVRRLSQLSDMLGGPDNSSAVVLPGRLDDPALSGSGVDLSLILPAEEVTIVLATWAPAQASLAQAASPSKEKPPPKERRKQSTRQRTGTSRSKKSKKIAPASSSKPVRASPPGELPLEDNRTGSVNVEFEKSSKSAK